MQKPIFIEPSPRDLVRPDTQVFHNRARGQTGPFTRFCEGSGDKKLPLRHARTRNSEQEQQLAQKAGAKRPEFVQNRPGAAKQRYLTSKEGRLAACQPGPRCLRQRPGVRWPVMMPPAS
jgi:hypothetical protein